MNITIIRRMLGAAAILLGMHRNVPGQTPPDAPVQAEMIMSEFIFEEAPFPQCHASTIAETAGGELVAAWFGGTREKSPDVGIWLSRREAGGWTAPVEVANGVQYAKPDGGVHRHPCWNPVLFQPRQGPLMLFYKCGPTPSTWWGMLMTSGDGGRTWTAPRRLPEGIDGPVKNKPVELEDGTILCPSSTEHDGWRLHFEMTRDFGATWTRTGPVNEKEPWSAIQPAILRHPGGLLQALCRTRNYVIAQTWSRDGGLTWSALETTGLPNPNAGPDALTLADGRHILVYNHTTGAGATGGREMLNVALSEDGRAWQAALVLENTPGAEFSYPAVIQTADGRVHITYTWQRRRIRHVVIEPAALNPKPMRDGKWPE